MDNKVAIPEIVQNAISSVDWEHWEQYGQCRSIPNEIWKIFKVHDDPSSAQAVIDVEYATGNAEAGTYYPSVIATIPILSLIVQHGGDWARCTALEILHDWIFMFSPEHKYREHIGTNERSDLKIVVRDEISKIFPEFEKIAQRGDIMDNEITFLRDLLEEFSEDR